MFPFLWNIACKASQVISQNHIGFFDGDMAGYPLTLMSITGLYVFLGANWISNYSKKQHTRTMSGPELEYRSLISLAAKLTW
uniref:Uncharacterized protein n=1 Tax=Solanum lycopersicum TaxID=4081 RepID=A0A3Q7EWG5_SOLLC